MKKNVTNIIDPQLLSRIKPSDLNEPKSIITPSTQDMVDLAIELWRLENKLTKVKDKLSDDENKALNNSLDRIKRFLSKNDLEVIDYTGQNYNKNMVVDVLHTDKDPSLKHNIIFQTHEPAVLHLGKLYRKAKVIIHEK